MNMFIGLLGILPYTEFGKQHTCLCPACLLLQKAILVCQDKGFVIFETRALNLEDLKF